MDAGGPEVFPENMDLIPEVIINEGFVLPLEGHEISLSPGADSLKEVSPPT